MVQHHVTGENWVKEKEEEQLNRGRIKRPDTKWVFEDFFSLDFKLVLDRQPLVGTGPLPDWLRNLAHSQAMIALDTFEDNLCL